MRNIVVVENEQWKIKEISEQIESIYINEHSKRVYLISKSKQLTVILLNNQQEYSVEAQMDLSQEILTESPVINSTYILELEALIIIFKNGEMFKVSVESEEVEEVGAIESGVVRGEWSEDQERLVLVTGNRTLVMLDSNIDFKGECELDDGDGSEGREVDLDKEINMSWRGDSKYFVTNFGLCGIEGRKCLMRDTNMSVFKSAARSDKVLNNHLLQNDSLVQSVSEKPININGLVSWQPQGSLMVSTQMEGDKEYVIMWEKNGLRHGQFLLEKGGKAKGMFWNSSSEVLAVIQENNRDCIRLYVRSNYQWYCKQSLMGLEGKRLMKGMFSGIDNGLLYMFYDDGCIESVRVIYDHNGNQLDSSGHQHKSVYVNQDGRYANMTNFKESSIPPPFYSYQIKITSDIIGIQVFGNESVIISEDKIQIYNEQTLVHDLDNSYCGLADRVRHVQYVNNQVIFTSTKDGQYQIVQIDLTKKTSVITPIPHNITVIFHQSQYYQNRKTEEDTGIDSVYYQSTECDVYKYSLADQDIQQIRKMNNKLRRVICYLDVKSQREIMIGLSIEKGRLMLDNHVLSSECTSFSIIDQTLLFTTGSNGMYHNLYAFGLCPDSILHGIDSNMPQVMAQLAASSEVQNITQRHVEKGSRIVAVVDQKLVLQICPRGNLETINPRLLMFKHIHRLVKDRSYKEAFVLLRTHKLDMNLLFDLDPEFFLNNTIEVAKSLNSPDYLGLLLQHIEAKTSPWMQQFLDKDELSKLNNYSLVHGQEPFWKVNVVCDALRKALEQIDSEKYVLIMISTYVKKQPAQLDKALEFVLEMKQSEGKSTVIQEVQPPHLKQNVEKKREKKKISSQQALEYICWLADANKMYEVALSSYDLEMVAMVALQTQKDPREYMPYLQALKQITNDIDRKTQICLDQKHYTKAVQELAISQQDTHQKQALSLIIDHHLYHMGITMFKEQQTVLTQIHSYFGDYLMEMKEYQQAILQYLKAKDYLKCIEGYKHNGQWKECLRLAEQHLCYGETEMTALKETLIEHLIEESQNSQAGHLSLLCNKTDQAIELYKQAQDYQSLIDLLNAPSSLYNVCSSLESTIQQHLLLQGDLKGNELKQQLSDFKVKYARLLVVQEGKKHQPVEAGEILQHDNDAMSEQSQLSQGTFTSIRTAGGGRRKQRKNKSLAKRNIREGSFYEEQYLVEILQAHKLTQQDFQAIQHIVQFLVYFDQSSVAKKLWDLAEDYVQQTNKNIKMFAQIQFEQLNPGLPELYPHINHFHVEKVIKTQVEIKAMFSKYSHLAF